MKLYASLHTKNPTNQADNEVAYEGYTRLMIDYDQSIGLKESKMIIFPEIKKSDPLHDEIKFIAFGHQEKGVGGIERVIECLPNLPIVEGHKVKVLVANVPEPLPDTLHPIAKVLWNYINNGDINPNVMPPDLYEALNDELARVGVPVIKITRSGAAKMDVKISKMKSLSLN